jgi:hypothetical protein
MAHQGCITLELARADASGREVFPLLSDGQSNPEGWQKVAGASFQGCRGNDHRFTGDITVASWRDARTVRIQVKPAISKHDPRKASHGTHCGCVIRSAFTVLALQPPECLGFKVKYAAAESSRMQP